MKTRSAVSVGFITKNLLVAALLMAGAPALLKAQPCPPGYYSTNGLVPCVPAPPGRYAPFGAMAGAIPAPPGYFVSVSGSDIISPAPI